MDNKFKIFVIIAIVVLFTGMAAGGFYIVKKASSDVNDEVEVEAAENSSDISVFSLEEPITTNLASEDENNKKQHVIKVSVGFGVNSKNKDFKTVATQLVEKEMLVRNEIIQALRDQTYESMTKPDAQSQLSDVIVSRLSELFATESIEKIYFGDFFVQ